jgi:Cft2 family RNA processing exonuclease
MFTLRARNLVRPSTIGALVRARSHETYNSRHSPIENAKEQVIEECADALNTLLLDGATLLVPEKALRFDRVQKALSTLTKHKVFKFSPASPLSARPTVEVASATKTTHK